VSDAVSDALAGALVEHARTVTREAPPLSQIRRRVARRRIVRRRRNLGIAALGVVVLAALVVFSVTRGSPGIPVKVAAPGQPGTAQPQGTAGLADTTANHGCPSGDGIPSGPATTVVATHASTEVVVPQSVPAGLCLVQADNEAMPRGQFELTALATCATCADPSAAVAISRSTKRDTWDNGTTVGLETGRVAGVSYAYKPPLTATSRAMLAVPADASTGFVLIGFGLSKSQYLTLATQVLALQAPYLSGLQTVYDGPADSNDNLVPGDVTLTTTLRWVAPDGTSVLAYSYLQGPTVPPISAFAWQYPEAATSPSNGVQSALVMSRGNGYTVLSEPASNALVTLDYRSLRPAVNPAELLSLAQSLRPLSATSTLWTSLVAAGQRHLDNQNPTLYP
jgi:hypothetical protein